MEDSYTVSKPSSLEEISQALRAVKLNTAGLKVDYDNKVEKDLE